MRNIFEDINSPKRGKELFKTLLSHKNVKIEFIHSNSIENGVLYDQDHDEWVAVLTGSAVLEIGDVRHTLNEGDFIFIKANTPHRVISTDEKTLWLAVHIF
ncbi:cupin domain-containing protein [Sulfurimonas sp. HSL-1716]|uniref:cupin domain-containing protein n=1 Tax=Hydrocurvibacter sulfurireducens TaxID=3131937 RepID=UPI0031F9EFE9